MVGINQDILKRIKQLKNEIHLFAPSSNNSLGFEVSLEEVGVVISTGKSSFPTKDFWDGKVELSRSEQRLVFYFFWLRKILKEDPDCPHRADKLLQSILDWWNLSSDAQSLHALNNHDEAIVRRIFNLLYFVCETDQVLPANRLSVIFEILQREYDILSENSFFAGLNNHGFSQCGCLLLGIKLGFVSKDLTSEITSKFLKIVSTRIGADGVLKEHSPEYHFMVKRDIDKYFDSLNDLFDAEQRSLIRNFRKLMDEYCSIVIMPNGTLPPIGDTFQTRLSDKDKGFYFNDRPVESVFRLFEEAGQFVFSGVSEHNGNAFYGIITGGHHSNFHKHNDDLALTIFTDDWIFCESGPHSYDYQDEKTQFAYSNLAHNTLVLDETPFYSRHDGVGEVKLYGLQEIKIL